jgi:hypothetical protein
VDAFFLRNTGADAVTEIGVTVESRFEHQNLKILVFVLITRIDKPKEDLPHVTEDSTYTSSTPVLSVTDRHITFAAILA